VGKFKIKDTDMTPQGPGGQSRGRRRAPGSGASVPSSPRWPTRSTAPAGRWT
jgi:hypothetical protein